MRRAVVGRVGPVGRVGRRLGLALALWLVTATASAQEPCDRGCLESMLDRYVVALVARNPSHLPATPSAVFTENGQRLELGDGLWHTVTGRGGYALRLADVERGQAVWMGTIREAGVPTILVARLKVAGGRIEEVETLVVRNEAAARSLDAIGMPRPTWSEAVPAAERHTRADLVRIANAYFSGIEKNDGRGVYPIADSCARLENGAVTAGDPGLVLGAAAAAARSAEPARPRTGCRQQFESGVFFYVTRIRDRRFVLVDPERGLAFAFAFFDNGSGDARNGVLADGRRVVSGPAIPWTWQIAEVFKIERGLIGPVESVLHQVPYGMGSGWSSWEEAMSSRPREVR
jgi:hypothetical protein